MSRQKFPEMPHVNVVKDVWREDIKLGTNFWQTGIFSRVSGIFKGGGILLLEEGSTSWDLGACFRIIVSLTRLLKIWNGDCGRLGFYPYIHGGTKVCLFDEGCELWWVLMGRCADLFRVILNIWCIMGIRPVCWILVVFTVDIREQRARRFLYLVRRGLYIFYVEFIEEMT